MEEEYMSLTKAHLNKPKIVLKEVVKDSEKFKQIRMDTIKKLGGATIPETMRKRLNFWNVFPESKYLELDTNFKQPFHEQYLMFVKTLDTTSLPPLKTLKCLDLKNLTKRAVEKIVQPENCIEQTQLRKIWSAKNSEKDADLLCKKKLDLESGKTLMVHFKIFQQNLPYVKGIRNPPRPKLAHSVILHGDCTLANLRDSIYCEVDFAHCKDPYDPFKLNKDRFPSGMFYINNTFYIDKRMPGNEDISVVVKKWGEKRGINLGETFLMESTLIKDLIVRKNYPYLYQHIGNCEHFIVVDQIKLLNPNESHCSLDYPKLYDRNIKYARCCMSCHRAPRDYIVTGSKRILDDITQLCKMCYESFFYVDGVVIEGHFQKFSFLGPSCSSVCKVKVLENCD